ncbi:MAG: cell surface protein SprA [Dysgonamonadaceae bacterium]|jgi:cell surface protein SprA|nr:cell surface protein SprA [Dysgonamonadaceae bacterium]
MRNWSKYILILLISPVIVGIYPLNADRSISSMENPEVVLIPEDPRLQDTLDIRTGSRVDTARVRYPVSKIAPEEYDDLKRTYPVDLQNPQSFDKEFYYDPTLNRYIYRAQVGGMEITTPLMLTPEEYQEYSFRKSMSSYFKMKNREEFEKDGEKEDVLSGFDFKFDLGPAEKIFGPGGVKLTADGSVDVKMAITRTSNGNPTLSESQRNRTTFDFDSQIQAGVNATVGDRVGFGLNYNTESTFDIDSKKLKLGYEGKEDEIIKVLEAGNVSMNTSNSLIRGGASLFGIKTELQFGKFNIGAVFSQQEAESNTVSSRGQVQTTPFEIKADAYEENRHFFLSQYFRDIYDRSMRTLPQPSSGIKITKLEVWVTNKNAAFEEARNIVAYSDLGENTNHISNPDFVHIKENVLVPGNNTNDLYMNLVQNYTMARDINTVNQAFQSTPLEGGRDYEKIDKARRLTSNEYSFNSDLGYISLTGTTLQSDEVLAVAFEYKNAGDGKYYQVGEFSSDNTANTDETLYLKLLKGTTMSPDAPFWDLMMKNVYSLGGFGIQPERFKLNIKYQNDTTGTYLNYIPEGNIANQLLLRVMNLDRLDATGNANPDGYFDYQEGYTIQAQQGVIIFPVVEPFGEHLWNKIGDDALAEKYVFQELYDSTLTVARQVAEKNKFVLTGEYKGSASSSGISMGGSMVAPGSVRVTANGVALIENVHYTVDYATGNVTVIDPAYQNVNIKVESDSHSGSSGMQRKTMMGLNLSYDFNPNFSIGATVMRLSEMPLTMKVNMGGEAIANTIYGFNFNYSTQSQWLTNLLDKLPFTEATAPSLISLRGEFAQLLPGHYESEYGGKYSYIDDFENSEMTLDWRTPYNWNLASTPYGDLFPEAKLSNDVTYGYNRALLAWYYIDGLFTRSSTMTPNHIRNDKEQLSNHYVREVKETELFPNRRQTYSTEATIPVFNLSFYPRERGPYNLDAREINPDGTLMYPEKRWGGITRRIESGQTDFEAANIENIEFWLLDPFIYGSGSSGGDLYFNLGEVSEDVLKDERKFAENGLPLDGDPSKVDTTVWGVIPRQQALNYAFDNSSGAREIQDVGLNGLSKENERMHPSYVKFLNDLEARLSPSIWDAMLRDRFSPRNSPSGDLYHFFRGSDYDDENASILERYKRVNGTEGNSVDSDNSGERYNTAAKLVPDVEDLNQDNTLNENEKYFQYKVSIRPQDMVVGRNFIADKREAQVLLKNGSTETVSWYQFKIPIRDQQGYKNIGNIRDFKTIRFARMFLTNFSDSVILRFGTLELVRGEWRGYLRDLSNPNMPTSGTGTLVTSTVNIEENSKREPVNYVLPPGVNRIQDPSQMQMNQQNEQSLALRATDLESGDSRAIYKNTSYNFRQYKRIQMFAHAERLKEDMTSDLRDDEFSIFLRLGSDYKNNYYEYEIPLKLTPAGQYSQNSNSDREVVWPETNMFNFPFEVLTNLKLERNREKRQAGSTISYQTPFSTMDPDKPMNKVTVVGNPSVAEVKVVMIGIRNNSMHTKSAEVWINELRLTEFNEENGWAANGNLFIGLSDIGTFNFKGSKETSGFGSLDQGIMERNIDDHHQFSIMTAIDAGRLFPEKAKIKAPFHYAYEEDITSPKYNPLDQDILLKQALDEVSTSAEKDSIKSFAQTKAITKEIGITSFNIDVRSKNPMPYDPANFTLGYVFTERNRQDATTTYDRETMTTATLNYSYSPMIKPVEPFKGIKSNSGALKIFKDFGFSYLPNGFGFTSNITRNYYEVQLRDLNSPGENLIDASFREDFYWNRGANLNWDLTKNLKMSITTGTKARIDAPHVQVNKNYNRDDYNMWKDSVIQSIKDLGTPLNYNQVFTADYTIPFKSIPVLNFITGTLSYNATYNWEKGAQIQVEETEDNFNVGNTIRNERTMGLNNLMINFLPLYEKSSFLSEVNKKFTFKRLGTPAPRRTTARAGRGGAQDSTATKNRGKKPVVERKKYEAEITLNPDSGTIVNHNLNNKRLRLTARGEDGKLYQLKFKSMDKNSIRIKNEDTVKLKLAISQLAPIEETAWYKVAQVAARGLMMVRSVNVSYNMSNSSIIPNFSPNVGDFLGQGSTAFGKAPGWDYAFGFSIDEGFLDKAARNDWLLNNSTYISPAIFNENETFSVRASLEPFTGFRLDLNADRVTTSRREIDFMNSGSPVLGGTYNITTIAIGSAFESPKSSDGYRSKTFDKFMANRQVIYNRLEHYYTGTQYPSDGFIASSVYDGAEFNPNNGDFTMNSQDVLIPAFIAAYTGKDPNKISLSPFPSLSQILPNWKVTYDGLMQIEFFNRHFKSFLITHQYNCKYVVGNYTSHGSWVDHTSGLGYIQSQASGPVPSSPYSISAASITEAFNPLIAIDGTFRNNMTLKFGLRRTRNINLNVSSNQIVEINQDNVDVGLEYKISEFNKIMKFRKSGGNNFSNDLKLSGMVTFQRMSNLIRRIQDSYTQASAGESQTMIRLAADYNLSRALTIQAFYDRQVTSPLVTTTSYPMSKSSFGININLSLMQ